MIRDSICGFTKASSLPRSLILALAVSIRQCSRAARQRNRASSRSDSCRTLSWRLRSSILPHHWPSSSNLLDKTEAMLDGGDARNAMASSCLVALIFGCQQHQIGTSVYPRRSCGAVPLSINNRPGTSVWDMGQ